MKTKEINFNTTATREKAISAKMAIEKVKIPKEPRDSGEKIDINKVIEKALETLEIDLESFKKIAGEAFAANITHNGRPSLDHVLWADMFNILRRLHLYDSVVLSGYDQEKHLGAICGSINRKEFQYKQGKLVKAAWKRFKRNRWESEGKLFGFRLLWRIRIKRWFSNLRIFRWRQIK